MEILIIGGLFVIVGIACFFLGILYERECNRIAEFASTRPSFDDDTPKSSQRRSW
jgi:hypothetical protein